jgi:cyclomaltodextrinase / maltogenic alpha-amylase / neopullulanase
MIRVLKSACRLLVAVSLLCAVTAYAGEDRPDIAHQPARTPPEWLKSGVIYQIFPRAFSPQGNLNGVTARLDDLEGLGVNILWIMPIHPIGQANRNGSAGSPYAVRDYYAIDPALGTEDDLRRLVSEAHRHRMKVILDMVANHTAWDSVMLAHPEFYQHDAQGRIAHPYNWLDVAALDYSNPDLRKYMIDVLVYWVRNFDIDGYRCDTAASVPTDFWQQARLALEQVKPDILMLAEASKPELLHRAFDIDYAWPSLTTLNDVMMNGAPATTIRITMETQQALFPTGALHMRITDDHDELRALTRFGYKGALAAFALNATLDGAPLVYNGNEVGDSTQSTAPALFETEKIFWMSRDWHPDTPKFYAALIALRRQHAALQQGETLWLHNSAEQHVVTYLRRAAGEEFLIAINLSNTCVEDAIDVSSTDWREIELPAFKHDNTVLPNLRLDAFGVRIFQREVRQVR